MRLLNWPISHPVRSASQVSILVLVDAPLEFCLQCLGQRLYGVSILVLVDAPLESGYGIVPNAGMMRFNPCFSGCAS